MFTSNFKLEAFTDLVLSDLYARFDLFYFDEEIGNVVYSPRRIFGTSNRFSEMIGNVLQKEVLVPFSCQ